MNELKPFNPLDKRNIGVSVADALLMCEIQPLPPSGDIAGAGVYAIYYSGSFGAYSAISKLNSGGRHLLPIYVGKAVPPGTRKGGALEVYTGNALQNRLSEHAESIRQTKNLLIDDFSCRYLVVEDLWITLGETLLINMFNPLWNTVVDGFGNHDPGSGRYNQSKSPWDVLHPGRYWAAKLTGVEPSSKDVLAAIREYSSHIKKNPGGHTHEG